MAKEEDLARERKYATYMSGAPRLERSTINRIIVEAFPLLKRVSGALMSFLGVPNQHFRGIVDSNFRAVSFNDGFGVVEKVIGVDNGDANFTVLQFAVLSGNSGTDLIFLAEKVEDAAEFIVAGLGWHEVVETGDFVKRGDGASPVRWNAVTRVSNQEGEMKLL